MMASAWTKTENEAGYPCYINNDTKKEQFDHPRFSELFGKLEEYNAVKYSVYRTAFKAYMIQKLLQVPLLRISTGVFARHCLSLSESSLTLEATELEAVLTDIYFAAEKEGLFIGNIDSAVELMLNLLLNVYDGDRKQPIRVLAAKTLLILLAGDSSEDKWAALSSSFADHNGCVSPRRLATLLANINDFLLYIGENEFYDQQQMQSEVDSCYSKSAGMLGMSAQAVASWALSANEQRAGCCSTLWLPVLQRISASRSSVPGSGSSTCSVCAKSLHQVLRFSCTKCANIVFCEKCYLYDADLSSISGHKKTHIVQEIIDGQGPPSECLGFIKKFFFCTKNCNKKMKVKRKKNLPSSAGGGKTNAAVAKGEHKPTIFTSTVGKASGSVGNNPAMLLHDIINQLESQNRALKDLSEQLVEGSKGTEDKLRHKVDSHWGQIATQINRLKILKDNLSSSPNNIPVKNDHAREGDARIQAFDLFSPIPMLQDEKQSKLSDNLKNQPRVLSLDSGNFSVASKPSNDSQQLMMTSGDALKPVVVHATSDSISTVSMNDISTWYANDPESLGSERRVRQSMQSSNNRRTDVNLIIDERKGRSDSLCVTEARYDADLKSVASSNDKMKELNADLDTVLDRLQQILSHNFVMDDSCFDNTQLRETANEMEGLLGTLIRGVEQRATLNAGKVSTQ